MNVNHVTFALSVQLDHELVEYATAVLADGHRLVFVIVQVVLDDEFIHVLSEYVVQLSVGIPGAVASIRIFLLFHSDHAAHGETNVRVASFVDASLIVHQSNVRAVVFR